METTKFKCNYCIKEFTTIRGKNKHELDYCTTNPNSKATIRNNEHIKNLESITEPITELIVEVPIIEQEPIIEDTEPIVEVEEKYTELELEIIAFVKDIDINNIIIPPNQKKLLGRIFKKLYGKTINVNCVNQSVTAFTSIYYWTQQMIKNK